MTITMDPNVLGVVLLPWTTLMTLLGSLGALAYMLWVATALGLSRLDIYRLLLRTVLWALFGARLFHVADYADFYREVPFQIFYIWNGGLSLWGAMVIGLAGAVLHAKRWYVPVGTLVDKAVVAGLVAIIIGRFGDFLAGKRVGTSTSLPWGATFTHPGSESFRLGVMHPVALYEVLLGLVLLAAIVRWGNRVTPDGTICALALAGYAVGKFIIASATVTPLHLGLDHAQWVSLAVLVATAYRWRVTLRR